MSTLVTVVSLWIGAFAAVLTPIVYGVGSRWWTSYWGVTLIAKDVVIALAYLRSVTSLIGVPLPDHVPGVAVSISVAMMIVLVANLIVMIVVTKRGQKREARR